METVPDAVAKLVPVAEVTREDLIAADGIALGSPTYYGNMSGTTKGFILGQRPAALASRLEGSRDR